jgi:DNA gyrase subunit B
LAKVAVTEERTTQIRVETDGHAPSHDGSTADGQQETPALKKIDTAYDADNLGVLKGLEAVRHRPGMYIGDVGTNGLHHLFKEIIDNSIDEVLAGHCTEISVVLSKDHSLSVEDNGRGIPVDIHKDSGKSGVELVLTELHAGGKFGEGGYKVSGGLHGVGASCVNALSEWLTCEVRRNGKLYRQRFERGVPVTPLQVVGKCAKDEHGTRIAWLADKTMFGPALDEKGDLHFSPERFAQPDSRAGLSEQRGADSVSRSAAR